MRILEMIFYPFAKCPMRQNVYLFEALCICFLNWMTRRWKSAATRRQERAQSNQIKFESQQTKCWLFGENYSPVTRIIMYKEKLVFIELYFFFFEKNGTVHQCLFTLILNNKENKRNRENMLCTDKELNSLSSINFFIYYR